MNAPSITSLVFRPTRISFLAHLHTRSPFDLQWGLLLSHALGDPDLPLHDVGWSMGGAPSDKLDSLMPELRRGVTDFAHARWASASATPADLSLYQGAALFCLWEEFAARIQRLIDKNEVEVPFYDVFLERHRFLFGHPGLTVPEPAHLLALFYQARRVWYFAATMILGRSPSAMAVRAAIWRANMGGDICIYAESLYGQMDEFPVLITGETGTGKDLVAQCIGWSRYIPFDAGARRFARKYGDDFHARSICEVPEELLASTLFGHKRGSFTGATADATGFFALPKQHGSLFLDEVGEIRSHVQAKLLRPLQNREYVPVGGTHPIEVQGRLIFATNCDLEAMSREGKFRSDLLERMSGLRIHLPPLRQMLAEMPEDLRCYVRAFVGKKVHDPARAETATERVMETLHATRADYLWPRNLRELQHETERILLGHGIEHSVPAIPPLETASPAADAGAESVCSSSDILGRKAKAGEVTAERLILALVKRVHVLTGGNVAATADKTGLDRRTVIKKLDHIRLARLRKRSK